MNICPKCKQVNEDNAKVCYYCGHKLTKSPVPKRLMKLLLAIIIVVATGAVGFGVWYFLQPKYYIYPEISKITMNGDGDSKEIKIKTDAPYSEWAAYSGYSWINVIKKESSIIIECYPNDRDELGERTGDVAVFCTSGRNQRRVYIDVEQGEDTKTIRGEVKKVSAYYTNDSQNLIVKVKCDIYNLEQGWVKCAAWFSHKDGTKLMDTNRQYSVDSDGQVTVQEKFFVDSQDNTFKLSIPIDELHLSESEEITIDVGLFEYESDDDGRRFVQENKATTFYVVL